MTALVTLEWPMTLKSASNLREHWSARHKRVKVQRLTTALMLRANGVGSSLALVRAVRATGPEARLVVTLTRVAPRLLDDDNLRGAFKGVRDEVAAFFGLDDGDVARMRCEYQQSKGKPSSVRIEIGMEKP